VSTSLIASASVVAERAPLPRVASVASELPVIAAGQLWIAELPLEGPLPAPVHHALRGANVVIYDRALAGPVAQALSFGGYAEPADAAAGQTAAARSVRFARDGWSVARLLPAGLSPRERTRRVQDIVDELAAARILGRLPVLVIAQSGEIEERVEARFDDLAAIVGSYPRDTLLTVVIAAFSGAGASRLYGVAANGLAG
jgi:hypothetical protein